MSRDREFEAFLLQVVGQVWTIFSEMMPKRTLEELSHLFEDVRAQAFDDGKLPTRARLEVSLDAARQAKALLEENGNPSEAAIAAIDQRIAVLEKLLAPICEDSETVIGTPVEDRLLRYADCESPQDFVKRAAVEILERLLEDRKQRDDSVMIRTHLELQRKEVERAMDTAAPGERDALERRLAALHFAAKSARSAGQPPSTDDDRAADAPAEKEIVID